MEFYNAASRLYVLHFIEVAEMGNHRVLYFMLNLADGKRGGAEMTHAINRIFHLWARSNQDVIDGKVTFFDGAGHHAEGHGLHFMVIHHLKCKDIAQLKTYILENSDAFATCIREQIELLIDIKEQMHESDHAVC